MTELEHSDWPERSQVVRTFGKEATEFIEVAASLGWRVLFNSTGTSITVIPHDDGAKRIHLSNRNKGGGLMRKYARTLARYASPDAVERAALVIDSDLSDEMKRALYLQFGAEALSGDGMEVMPPEEPKERFVPTPADVAERVKKERRIVSERPAMMHLRPGEGARPGKSYPSQTTVERLWSDGVVDYACALPTCGETSENRLAFRGSHWGMHVRRGEAQPIDETDSRRAAVDDPSYTEPAYSRKHSLRERRRHELANLLQGIDLSSITPEDLADQIMSFLESQSGGGGGALEPLTPEQILDRIRSLVDTGTYYEQEQAILERDRQIEDLMTYSVEREAALEQQVLELQQRATVAEAHLQALRDLINEQPGEPS